MQTPGGPKLNKKFPHISAKTTLTYHSYVNFINIGQDAQEDLYAIHRRDRITHRRHPLAQTIIQMNHINIGKSQFLQAKNMSFHLCLIKIHINLPICPKYPEEIDLLPRPLPSTSYE